MKKYLLFLLFLIPAISSADSVSGFAVQDSAQTSPAAYILVDESGNARLLSNFTNNSGVTKYVQFSYIYAGATPTVCMSPYTVTTGNSQAMNDQVNFTITDKVSFILIYSSASNSVDADGCLNSSPTEYDLYYSQVGNDEIQFLDTLGSIQYVYVLSTSTNAVDNNPTLDWFLGFLIFFICMIFPIWLFRRK